MHYPLHNQGFRGRHEIDILVVNRQSGITVVEVKGITIDQLSSIQGGDWYYNNYAIEKGNPYKQAETQLNILCNEIEQNPQLFRKFTKRVVIALPYITRSEWEKKGIQNNIVHIPPILFKDDLTSVTEIQKFEEYFLYSALQPLENTQWELMKQFFGIKENESMAIEEPYSTLYVFPVERMFEQKKREIKEKLTNGVKITILSYFEMDITWKNLFEEFTRNYQLQCFSSVNEAPIEDGIVIEDGEEILPERIVNDFKSFNYEQYQAVHTPYNSHLMVKAGIGTGKTHVMIDRIMFLLTKNILLRDIIMITFTNESTNEMKKRLKDKLTSLSKLTGKTKYGLYAEDVKEMQISTIHSFSKSILTS